jgi:hypothetical protein
MDFIHRTLSPKIDLAGEWLAQDSLLHQKLLRARSLRPGFQLRAPAARLVTRKSRALGVPGSAHACKDLNLKTGMF